MASLSMLSRCVGDAETFRFSSIAIVTLFFFPILFLFLLFFVNRVVFYCHVKPMPNRLLLEGKLRDISIKIVVWFCLVMFPALSAGYDPIFYISMRFLFSNYCFH
jgi:hypothetical protein